MSYMKKLLKPVFAAIAAPGIGHPHGKYETELMVAGLKPVIIISPDTITPEMQAAVDKGQIVHIDDYHGIRTSRIYCQKNEINTAKDAAKILDKVFNNKEIPTIAEEKFLEGFFDHPIKNIPLSFSFSNWRERSAALEIAMFKNQVTTEMHSMLEGKLLALSPFVYAPECQTANPLEPALAENKISAVDIKEKLLIQVFAQANRVEDGKELYARYYLDQHDYPALPDSEGAKRVGKLLGYTENDTAWFTGEKYKSPLLRTLMYETAPLRRWARKEVMLMDGPQ